MLLPRNENEMLLMPPLTLVAYELDLGPVVDFSGGYDPAHWRPLWQELLVLQLR